MEMTTILQSITSPILAEQAAGPEGNAMIFQLMIFGLIFAAMWFLLIAPQRKKQKQHAKMIEQLGTGDEVLTNGGIYGVITNVKDDRFVLKVSDNTRIEVSKSFVQTKVEAN